MCVSSLCTEVYTNNLLISLGPHCFEHPNKYTNNFFIPTLSLKVQITRIVHYVPGSLSLLYDVGAGHSVSLRVS